MGDQRIDLTNLIVAAINRVNTSIQKTQTYIDANTISLQPEPDYPAVHIIEVSSVGSPTLGILGVLTLQRSSAVGTPAAFGSLDSQPECISSVTVTPVISGGIEVSTELGSSAVEITSVGGNVSLLDVATKLRGSITETSELDAYINRHLLDSSAAETSTVSGDLDVATQLWGSATSTASAVDENDELYL